ncbi:34905_t:CDS:1, partial [Racocetra persica]
VVQYKLREFMKIDEQEVTLQKLNKELRTLKKTLINKKIIEQEDEAQVKIDEETQV